MLGWLVNANFSLVLTLPAFEWVLVDESHAGARFGHTCHLVANRQLLSIGGLDAGQKNPWSTPDLRAPQGLSVFDMSELRWKPGYTANAPHYERASVIQNLYDMRKYGKYPVYNWLQKQANIICAIGDSIERPGPNQL